VKRSNRLVILVGVLLAVLAFVAIVILLNQRPTQVPEEEQTQTVLVATEDIDIGEEVTPDKVEAQDIPPEAVQGEALTDVSAVSGQPALFAIPEGSQVNAAAVGLGTEVDICIECSLNPGEKAVAFQVDRVTGLDFLVRAGDTIDIVLTEEITVLQPTQDATENPDPEAPTRFEPVTGLENQRTVKAILQDKRVLYVSATRAIQPEPIDADGDGVPDPQQPEQEVIDAVIIVFAGTTQDAEVIKFAQNDVNERGALTAVIRESDDDVVEPTLGITIDQLVSEYGLRIPGIVEQLGDEEVTP